MKWYNYIIVLVFVFLIYTITFWIDGKPFMVLCDDEMISMYYAKNLFQGIEGYSNPLWTLIMIPLQILPHNLASLPIILINFLCIFGMMKLSSNPLFLGLTFPVLFWALAGVEFIPIAYLFLYGLKKNSFIPIILITLLRADGFVFSGILLLSTFNLKNLYAYAISVIGIFSIRFLFYQDFFPNTYYLKLGYPLLDRVERSFQWQNVIYFLAPAKYILPITLIFLYNLYIGGDAWEQYGFLNRFLIITIPLFFEMTSFKDMFVCKNI